MGAEWKTWESDPDSFTQWTWSPKGHVVVIWVSGLGDYCCSITCKSTGIRRRIDMNCKSIEEAKAYAEKVFKETT